MCVSYMYCSSRDPTVILQHFADLQRAKVRTIVVSLWGQVHKQESTDNQEVSTDLTVALLLTLADVIIRNIHISSMLYQCWDYIYMPMLSCNKDRGIIIVIGLIDVSSVLSKCYDDIGTAYGQLAISSLIVSLVCCICCASHTHTLQHTTSDHTTPHHIT
jgi:hypothetical protein